MRDLEVGKESPEVEEVVAEEAEGAEGAVGVVEPVAKVEGYLARARRPRHQPDEKLSKR